MAHFFFDFFFRGGLLEAASDASLGGSLKGALRTVLVIAPLRMHWAHTRIVL
jgi:hypothetical protein